MQGSHTYITLYCHQIAIVNASIIVFIISEGIVGKKGREWGRVGKKGREWGIVGKKGREWGRVGIPFLYTYTQSLPLL